jgi:fatty-acyl-CoA synthase
MPPQLFIADPGRWLVEISTARISRSSSPNFGYALATKAIAKGLPVPVDLSCWQRAGAGGGEAPDLDAIDRFVASARPLGFDPDVLTSTYAMTETGVISDVRTGAGLTAISLDRRALGRGEVVEAPRSSDSSGTFVSSGHLAPGVQLRVVSPTGEDLPSRRVGEFWVKSPRMFDGYLDDPDATNDAFTDGWFRTGDLGFLEGENLYVTGRSKDVIIVRGKNYHAHDIERVVRSVAGADEGNCAAFAVRGDSTDRLVLAVETRVRDDDSERLRKDIVRRVWVATTLRVGDVVFVPPGTLPVTASGKVKRSLTKERYLEEALVSSVSADE